MQSVADDVSKETGVALENIVRHGKLSQKYMEARRKVIRRIHATGNYTRTEIARYFGLSIYTITTSLEDSDKNKPEPFTDAEDQRIHEMHCAGYSIEQMRKALPERSVPAIRRRIAKIQQTETRFRSFPKPSYNSPAAGSRMLELAKKENEKMLKAL
tara:strand:- start:14678 stop:15148 length:471 start_codon:yes stop_codon:yes gene_type:complete